MFTNYKKGLSSSGLTDGEEIFKFDVDELSEKILIDRDLYYPEYPFEKGVKIQCIVSM